MLAVYSRVGAMSADTEDVLPKVAGMVMERPLTCMDWVMFPIAKEQLSLDVLI